MNRAFSFSALFLIAATWPNVVDCFDYCTIPCGKENIHTMCRWPPNTVDFSGKCKNSEMRLGMPKELKKALLHYHNLARSTLARGLSLGDITKLGSNATIQPKASNMMQLKWSNEAAAVAQRWANQCQFAHDTCRTLSDKTYLGQNLLASSGIFQNRTKWGDGAVKAWTSEVRYLNDPTFINDLVDKFDTKGMFMKIGHYTQMFWAKTTHVGCGLTEFVKEPKGKGLYLLCDYAPGGNVQGGPVYLRGEPCTKCPNGGECSTEYPGLCLASGGGGGGKDEIIEDDEIVHLKEGAKDAKDSALSFKLSPHVLDVWFWLFHSYNFDL